MSTAPAKVEDLTLQITEEIHVKAPIEITFESLIEELTTMTGQGDRPMPMKLEAWPGGRWYRDLGDNNGHYWATVQAIKRPTLLELHGPLMMSFAVVSNIQYRLSEEPGGTLIKFHHFGLGAIPEDFRKGVGEGWKGIHERVRRRSEESRSKSAATK